MKLWCSLWYCQKSSFTGAAASVDGAKALKDIPVTSFEQALAGTTPGLTINSSSGQPGAALEIRVRGTGSMNATNEASVCCGWSSSCFW